MELNIIKKNKFIVFFVLLTLVQLLSWLVSDFIIDANNESNVSKKILVSFGVGSGVTLTLFVCYLWVESARISENLSSYSMPVVLGFVFSLLALPFGLVVGIIGGGTFGGAWVSVLFEWLYLSKEVGIALGIGLGIFVGSVILVLPATMIGFGIGNYRKKL